MIQSELQNGRDSIYIEPQNCPNFCKNPKIAHFWTILGPSWKLLTIDFQKKIMTVQTVLYCSTVTVPFGSMKLNLRSNKTFAVITGLKINLGYLKWLTYEHKIWWHFNVMLAVNYQNSCFFKIRWFFQKFELELKFRLGIGSKIVDSRC